MSRANSVPDYWERRGSQIYFEEIDGKPGTGVLVLELYPMPTDRVQRIVDEHNNVVQALREVIGSMED